MLSINLRLFFTLSLHFIEKMNNFDICCNTVCRAVEKENVRMPSILVKMLKPDNIVYSSVVHKNADIDEADSNTTTSSEDFSADDSDSSDNMTRPISIKKPKNRKKYSTTE